MKQWFEMTTWTINGIRVHEVDLPYVNVSRIDNALRSSSQDLYDFWCGKKSLGLTGDEKYTAELVLSAGTFTLQNGRCIGWNGRTDYVFVSSCRELARDESGWLGCSEEYREAISFVNVIENGEAKTREIYRRNREWL